MTFHFFDPWDTVWTRTWDTVWDTMVRLILVLKRLGTMVSPCSHEKQVGSEVQNSNLTVGTLFKFFLLFSLFERIMSNFDQLKQQYEDSLYEMVSSDPRSADVVKCPACAKQMQFSSFQQHIRYDKVRKVCCFSSWGSTHRVKSILTVRFFSQIFV